MPGACCGSLLRVFVPVQKFSNKPSSAGFAIHMIPPYDGRPRLSVIVVLLSCLVPVPCYVFTQRLVVHDVLPWLLLYSSTA